MLSAVKVGTRNFFLWRHFCRFKGIVILYVHLCNATNTYVFVADGSHHYFVIAYFQEPRDFCQKLPDICPEVTEVQEPVEDVSGVSILYT